MNSNRLHSRRSFLKTLGGVAVGAPFVTRSLFAQTPARPLRHACFGTGGQAYADLTKFANAKNVEIVALCDVDLTRTEKARLLCPNARVYQDWRQLLEKEAKNIDSVNVSTPDHMHAPIALSAMQLGKHVYGQKPLAHNLAEVRQMTDLAKKSGLVTQMGIQIHSSPYYRIAVQILQDGTIGKIKEVHSWCNKSWGDPDPLPDRTDPVPPEFDWDLWLGVCAERPFIGDKYYHPGNWRKRLDFGTGTLGDMGCHIFDPLFESIGLAAPVSVRSDGPVPNEWNWALNGRVDYTFAGTSRTASDTLPVFWYDGAAQPPAEIMALIETVKFPASGSLLVGTDGVMLLPHPSLPKLFPSAKFKDFVYPRNPGFNHHEQFIEACRGVGKTTTDFAYAGPLTETILLGGIASRFPQTTLKWNAPGLEFDLAEANRLVRREYRKGFSLPPSAA